MIVSRLASMHGRQIAHRREQKTRVDDDQATETGQQAMFDQRHFAPYGSELGRSASFEALEVALCCSFQALDCSFHALEIRAIAPSRCCKSALLATLSWIASKISVAMHSAAGRSILASASALASESRSVMRALYHRHAAVAVQRLAGPDQVSFSNARRAG